MLSFIVPAHNEAASIERCVASIRMFAPRDEPHEVIVVENRSTDDTAERAARAGARVLRSVATTVAAVRNEGVAAAIGDMLIFIDGDCHLTPAWGAGIADGLRRLRAHPRAFLGSHPVPPSDEQVFLWRRWFVPFLQHEGVSHLGSAHLACARRVFDDLGGFDARFETGEDFNLCARLLASGGTILLEPTLVVEHEGFPRTLRAFVRRERWHGRGDAGSWGSVLRSRVALLSLSFAATLVAAVVALLVGKVVAALVLLAGAALLVATAALVRFRGDGIVTTAIAATILPFYFAGRAAAVVDARILKPGLGR